MQDLKKKAQTKQYETKIKSVIEVVFCGYLLLGMWPTLKCGLYTY